MRDPRIDQVADAIERRFPGAIVVMTVCASPDDPDIDYLFDVLNIPHDRDQELVQFTLELGDELFGYGQMPVLVGGVSAEWAAQHYSEYLNGAPARP